MTSAPPIGFEYSASRLLTLALLLVAVLAIIAVFTAAMTNSVRAVLVVLAGGAVAASLAGLLNPRVRTVLWRADGSVDMQLRERASGGQRQVHGELHAGHVLGPLITVNLRWPQRGRATLWLLPDNLDANTRRQLRMRLRSR